jgi:hypothetical protein
MCPNGVFNWAATLDLALRHRRRPIPTLRFISQPSDGLFVDHEETLAHALQCEASLLHVNNGEESFHEKPELFWSLRGEKLCSHICRRNKLTSGIP